MKRKIDPVEHEVNLMELHEMEQYVPMTSIERDRVRRWVYNGHSVSSNPWKYRDSLGLEMDYLDAYRRNLKITLGSFYQPMYQVIRNRFPQYIEDECELPFA